MLAQQPAMFFFWLCGKTSGETSGCIIPQESEGMSMLLERLQSLPNFDNKAVILAMQSTENQWFQCWKHPDAVDLL